MTKKTQPRVDLRKQLRPLSSDDLAAVSGGWKGKPGQYTSSTGGGGTL